MSSSHGTRIRVGIVGAGANSRARHLPNLLALSGVEVVAVCNRSRETSRRVADEFGIPRVHDDWSALVASDEIDAVVIGTWPNMHHSVTLAALQAGKHVLCEARMASGLAEAQDMYAAARSHPHLVTQLVPATPSIAFDEPVRRLMSSGAIGDPLAVEIRIGSEFVERDGPLRWRSDAAISGVNVMSLGIWYETVMRWLGDATWVVANARTVAGTRAGADGESRPVTVPDHLDVLATFPGGVGLNLRMSQVTGLAPAQGMYLYGTEGTLRLSDEALYVGRRSGRELAEMDVASGHWRVEEEFVNAIRGLEEVKYTTFADGVRYMAFTQAVHTSLLEGGAVAVPPI